LHFQIYRNGKPFDPEVGGNDKKDYEELINGMPKELDSGEQKKWEKLQRKKNRLEFRITMHKSFGSESNRMNNIERLMSKIVSVDKQIFLLKKKANMRKKPVVYIGELTVDKVEVVDEKGKK
jgi:hypothetical protein